MSPTIAYTDDELDLALRIFHDARGVSADSDREPRAPRRSRQHVTYSGAHQRLDPVRGRACVDCERPATDWSLSKLAPREHLRADPDGRHAGCPYSLDAADYEPRCHHCHIVYDRRRSATSTGAKLTLGQVGAIRRLAQAGQLSQREIGEQFGVCPSTVGLIVRGRTWTRS